MEITVPNGKFIIPDNYEMTPAKTDASGQYWEITLNCSQDANIEFVPIAGKALTKLEIDGVTIPFTASGGVFIIPISTLTAQKVVFQFCDGTAYTITIKIYDGSTSSFTVTLNTTGDGYVDTIYNNGIFAGLMFVPDDSVIQSITINGIPQTVGNIHGEAIVITTTQNLIVDTVFV